VPPGPGRRYPVHFRPPGPGVTPSAPPLARTLGVTKEIMSAVRRRPTLGFYFAVVPPLVLAADMVYESTALSWEHGPQMIGFSLMHTFGIILFPMILASLVWCVVTTVVPIFTKKWNLGNVVGVAAIGGVLGVASLSYGFWVQLFSERVAKGPYAADFFVHMAALGERGAVEALLAKGVPVNGSDRRGIRAIEAATNAKQDSIRSYLESKGGTDKRF
jgi:hypothetical protein